MADALNPSTPQALERMALERQALERLALERLAMPRVSGGGSSARAATGLLAKARRVLVLANRTAGARGGRRLADQTSAAVAEAGFEATLVGGLEELAALSAQLSGEQQLRAVVAIGGDGTVGAALNSTPPGTPLAVVPAGTENLLAKYLGLRARPATLRRLLTDGVAMPLDAGRANGRLFSLMISVGFDAEVVRRVHSNRTGNITHLAYASPILRTIGSYDYPPLCAEWTDGGGQRREEVGRWLFGVNLPRYAQGLPIVPEADGADGLLDLCLFKRGGTAAGLWYLWHIVRHRRQQLSSITSRPLARFRVDSPTADVPYQLDGDPGGVLPVEVEAVPQRLTLLVPRATAARLGFATAGE